MALRISVVVAFFSMLTAMPALGQAAPVISVDPTAVELGATTTVSGGGFEPGIVRIYFDGVDGAPHAEHEHTGQFNFLLEVSGVTPDVHEVIACNNQTRSGVCRQEAVTTLVVLAATTTTRAPPRTTTSTRPATTTTRPVTTRPTTTTTSARPPSSGTSTTIITSPVTLGPTPTALPIIVTTTNEVPVISIIPPSGADGADVLVGATTTTPAVDPAPTDVQIGGTVAPGFDLSTSDDIEWPDLEVIGFEVTQGIQDRLNRMPLVAERTTWVRLYVAVDRLPENAGDDTLTTGTVGSVWSYEGWPDVTAALWLDNGETAGVLYPENGPITAFGDGGDRLKRGDTLNFRLPPGYTADGDLDMTAFVWSQLPGTPVSQEPDAANNYADLTVDFHTADEPTTFAARLRNEDVWSAVSPAVFDNAVAQIEESLLTFHPISGTTVNQMLFLVDPGSEVTEEEDPDGNWDLETRGWEPNVRLGWYHALWDAADDEWFVGVAPQNASASWSGWANPGSHAFWTMGNTTTPGHEMGHAQGLLHVPCKDTNDPLGVADELAGGALDISHPSGLPNCSLAPVDPDGYFGFTTLEDLPSVYSNDPNASNPRFPFMSYRNPEWTDPYHTCLLLDSYGVPCDPASIGVPPVVQVADFGQADALAQVVPDTGVWEPMAPGNSFDGPIALFELSWGICDAGVAAPSASACGSDSATGDGTTNQVLTVETEQGPSISECEGSTTSGSGSTSGSGVESATPPTTVATGQVQPEFHLSCSDELGAEIGFALILDQPTTGAHGLFERQLEQATSAAPGGNDGAIDGFDFNVWQSSHLFARVFDSSGAVPGRVMPLAIDGLGHGGGAEVGTESNVHAVPWDAAYDTIEIVRPDGAILDTLVASRPPVIRIDDVVVNGREVAVSWTGDDPDGNSLLYNVSMSADGGMTWRPIAVLTNATSFVVTDEFDVAGGDQVVVRVTGTDGLSTGVADSTLMNLPDAEPRVAISATEQTVPRYAARILTASAFDPEDGVIEAITWSSDVDGELGVGRRVGTRWLSPGVHQITVAVTDSAGATAGDSLVLEVIDDGLAQPLVEGDNPEVDRLLKAAAGVELESVAGEGPQLEDATPPDANATATPGGIDANGASGASSSFGLTAVVIAGVGATGIGLGALSRRRRNTVRPMINVDD